MKSLFSAVSLLCLLTVCSVPCALAAPIGEPAVKASAELQPAAVANTVKGNKTAPAKKAKAVKKRAPVASKSKSAREVAQTQLPPSRLDLSLPSDMVRHLQPLGTLPQPKNVPLLPPLFGDKPVDNSAFQINGRLLSNEMMLQLRNEERRDVEGAALDFEFKQ